MGGSPRIRRTAMKKMGGTYDTQNAMACSDKMALYAVVEMT